MHAAKRLDLTRKKQSTNINSNKPCKKQSRICIEESIPHKREQSKNKIQIKIQIKNTNHQQSKGIQPRTTIKQQPNTNKIDEIS